MAAVDDRIRREKQKGRESSSRRSAGELSIRNLARCGPQFCRTSQRLGEIILGLGLYACIESLLRRNNACMYG